MVQRLYHGLRAHLGGLVKREGTVSYVLLRNCLLRILCFVPRDIFHSEGVRSLLSTASYISGDE